MKFRNLLLVAAVMLPTAGIARQLDAEDALTRALSENGTMLKSPGKIEKYKPTPVYTSQSDGIKDFYVFNAADEGGYIIVSADDCVAPILGYAEHGTFDIETIPSNMRWWLSQYDAEIKYAMSTCQNTIYTAPSTKLNIVPIVQSKWNQSSPYNDMCPLINGSRAVTGCVATAMAQIMYYHQWPPQGTGSNTYTPKGLSEITLDFSSIQFDWSAMTDTYSSSSSSTAQNAVAQLMYACGVSVNMDYGVSDSGASSADVPAALTTYFGYDKGMKYVARDYYFISDWIDLIYNELYEGRPVLYGGETTTNEGHEFVCDGYSDGYFHINWGWGGISDGYFLLTALDPYTQGIGGGSSAFTVDQDAVIGIQKAKEGAVNTPSMAASGDFGVKSTTINAGGTAEFTGGGSDGLFYNIGYETVNVAFGVKVEANGNTAYYEDTNMGVVQLQPGYGYRSYNVNFSGLASGTYTVTPAFWDSLTQQWYDILVPVNSNRSLIMNVNSSQITFSTTYNQPKLTVQNFTLDTPLFDRKDFTVSAKISSDEYCEQYVRVAMYAVGGNTPLIWSDPKYITVRANETIDFEFTTAMLTRNAGTNMPTAGTYQLRLVDKDRNPLSDPINVEYQQAPSSTSIRVNDLYVVSGKTAPINDINICGTLECVNGYFSGTLTIYVFVYPTGGQNVESFTTPLLTAEAGKTASFDMHVAMSGFNVGDSFFMQCYCNGWTGPQVIFTLSDAVDKTAQPNVFTLDFGGYTDSTPANTFARNDNGQWNANEIILSGSHDLYVPFDVEAKTITFDNQIVSTVWEPLYVPFSLTHDEYSQFAEKVYEFVGQEMISGETYLIFKEMDNDATLVSNHPYIFKPVDAGYIKLTLSDKTLSATPLTDTKVSPEGADYSLYGNYSAKTNLAALNAYTLSGDGFGKCSNNDTGLNPFEVYVLPNTTLQGPSSLGIKIQGDTGINDIINDADMMPNTFYDLLGRRVDNPSKGIYIINGTKVLIK